MAFTNLGLDELEQVLADIETTEVSVIYIID